jgi:hypothetical protein
MSPKMHHAEPSLEQVTQTVARCAKPYSYQEYYSDLDQACKSSGEED